MTLDPIGTFYGHKITFAKMRGHEAEYDLFFDYVSQPRTDGLMVELVHNQRTIQYEAYISQGERALKRVDPASGKVYWDKMSLNIVPMEAQVAV